MDQSTFSKLIEEIRERTTKTLVVKGEEYAGSADRLANFKRGSVMTGVSPRTVCFTYMAKHWDSLATYVKAKECGEDPKLSEPITGRLTDLINYAVLFWALEQEQEGQEGEKQKQPSLSETVLFRDSDGKTTRLWGLEADNFLRSVLHTPFGEKVFYQGERIPSWSVNGTDWNFLP